MVVQQELEKLRLHPLSIELGEVDIEEDNIDAVKLSLQQNLRKLGFDLLDDKKSKIIEKIKNSIVHLVHENDNSIHKNLSDYLSDSLGQDYSALSNLFSEVENNTIEQYYIQQRIEKVKELLMYDEYTLSEIANRLHYSSVAHLSSQFKKVTGFTPSFYKQLKDKKRRQIEDL